MRNITSHDLKMLGWAIARAQEIHDRMRADDNEQSKNCAKFGKNIKSAKLALRKLRFDYALEQKSLKQENELREKEFGSGAQTGRLVHAGGIMESDPTS